MQLTFISLLALVSSTIADPIISSFPNSLTLESSFDPIKAAYWTGLPHHRRTPFSVSPDGNSAYLAYLDASYSNVVIQQVNTSTFEAVGTAVQITGYEAAGLVAQNDGFAVMVTTNATGTTDLPPTGEYVTVVVRYKDGVEAWTTALNGPGVHTSDGLTATTDANGDLVYSSAAGLYGAYFVVTAYTGNASGHFGDSIQYVDDTGALQTITGASSVFGCSHNTGIGLEAADSAPFASICAEDQGDIWLNTDTQYMSGVKIANENTTNGVSGEPMGGMSGSYSNLALFPSTTNYIFAWQSRGALDLTLNAWMGSPYTQCSPRWLNHNVAISTMSSKDTLTGAEASSTVGAAEGDDQVNWITYSSTEDHQNVHTATLNSNLSIVTWKTLTSPDSQPVPLGCSGTYAGTSFQFVDSAGAKVGAVTNSTSVFVSGDIANVGTDRVCWPYVDMVWDLSAPKASGTPVTKMSFACASVGSSGSSVMVSSAVASPSSAAVAVSSAAGVATSSSIEAVVSSQAAIVSSSTELSHATSLDLSTSTVPISTSSTSSAAIENPSSSSTATILPSTTQASKTALQEHTSNHHTTFSTRVIPSPTIIPEDDSCDAE
ncbi:uncharacterized protein LY89DRAFT_786279 [Mollisia scopiformis]|uniref:Uncharacterized protein n=1 Tax=Mollisia scopiformis TaxID=149040 RepID=A0A194WW00_MOLSC|nr:uncharacterized protein LY89DRAFT_786279 [Mollisia scopiformis]KUJ12145.1 hypothetical protein LY89DRAFT_786279 [Mollisia scopiformis]